MSDLVFGSFGEQILEFIQSFSSDFLDLFFGIITSLGSTLPILIIFVLLYYTFNKEYILKIMYLLIISAHLNSLLKIFFHFPRPYVYDEKYKVTTHILRETVWEDMRYSFPSGHSQTQGALWGYIFQKYRNFSLVSLGIFLLISIPLSRSYLGLHWPSDILIGVIVGILVALVFVQIDKRYGLSYSEKSEKTKIFWSFLGSLFLLFLGFVMIFLTTFLFGSELTSDLWNHSDLGIYSGIFGGIAVGKVLEDKYINFKIYRRQPIRVLIRIIIGFTSIIILYLFTKSITDFFESFQSTIPYLTTLIDYCCYFILAFILALIVPWLFTKIESVILKRK